ncbi:MAG TPA: hypothetical protein PLK90_03665 [Clostridiales bacterium]|nr:hypothetical protein [Clostridiales bacterium]HQP69477.1 hypothetical protein [Clostridiales bacterium]
MKWEIHSVVRRWAKANCTGAIYILFGHPAEIELLKDKEKFILSEFDLCGNLCSVIIEACEISTIVNFGKANEKRLAVMYLNKRKEAVKSVIIKWHDHNIALQTRSFRIMEQRNK